MAGLHLTPQEERLYKVFSDGMTHSETELMSYLDDELSSKGALQMSITRLRKKIVEDHKYIVRQVVDGVLHYRLARRISPGE